MDEDLKSYFDQQFSAMRQSLEATMDRRFEAMDRRFESMDRRFESMDRRFESMEQRFESMEQRFESMEQRFESMEQRFDGKIDQLRQEMNQQFNSVKVDVRQAYVLIEDVQGQVRLVAEGVANCNEQLQRHREEVSEKLDLCEDLDLRVRRLEAAGDLPPTGSLRRSRAR